MLRVPTITDGIVLLLLIYYIFWMVYPIKRRCTFKYLQQIVLLCNAEEDGSVPPKLLKFIEKLKA
jgi:hypothetical protein